MLSPLLNSRGNKFRKTLIYRTSRREATGTKDFNSRKYLFDQDKYLKTERDTLSKDVGLTFRCWILIRNIDFSFLLILNMKIDIISFFSSAICSISNSNSQNNYRPF